VTAARPSAKGAARIEFSNVARTFAATNHGAASVTAVTDVNFRVEDAEVVSIIGPSGCGKSTYALLGALSTAGLTRNDLNIQGAGPVGVWKLFIAGQADAMAAVPDWIGIAQGQGIDVKIMPVEDYFPSMAQAILASDEVIAKNPELINKLVDATLEGMRMIMIDPAAAAADYVEAVPQHKGKAKAMEAVFRLYNKYVYPGQTTLGVMDEARLKKVQDFYADQGAIRRKSALSDLYTNQFVQ
jgi:NitT/TauT family transport system substrate-binding protein